MRSLARKVLLTAFAVATLMTTAGTAHAAEPLQALPPEYLAKVQWLDATPTDNMALGRQERSIWLKKGWYYFDLPSPPTQEAPSCRGFFELDEGTYSWRGQLDPKNGHYVESAVLEGPETARLECRWNPLPRDGDYSWGSELVFNGT